MGYNQSLLPQNVQCTLQRHSTSQSGQWRRCTFLHQKTGCYQVNCIPSDRQECPRSKQTKSSAKALPTEKCKQEKQLEQRYLLAIFHYKKEFCLLEDSLDHLSLTALFDLAENKNYYQKSNHCSLLKFCSKNKPTELFNRSKTQSRKNNTNEVAKPS